MTEDTPTRPLPPATRPPHDRGLPLGGIIILGAGVLLLLQTTEVLPWRTWAYLWRFWPVALIAVGVNLILGRRYPALAGIVVLLLLVGAVGGAVALAQGAGGSIVRSEYQAPLEGAETARVVINFGAGDLTLASLPATSSNLIEATFSTASEGAEVDLDRQGSAVELTMSVRRGTFLWFGGNSNWTVALSPTPALTLDVNGGAADVDLDLRDLRVTRLDLDIGAADVEVVLPANAGQTDVVVSSGASDITLVVPDGVAARITSSSGLSSIDVDESRFPEVEGGWRSPEFDSAPNRVIIDLRVGAASVRVR